jgi:HAD superfamily hydrolase (TIGR01509 family)
VNKLIIFDLDGVLLDSEPLYMAMNQKFFKTLGAEIGVEEYHTFVGISATTMWATIKAKAHLPQSVEELKALEKELKYKTLNETPLVPTEGVVELLGKLKAGGHTLTIASSGLRKNIDVILNKLHVTQYFDLVVSGEDVVKGKPGPDIFLKVSDHFRRKPEECVVIEDSKNGVLAAKAAGMICLAYYNPNSGNQDLSKADFIFDHFNNPKLDERLGLSITGANK